MKLEKFQKIPPFYKVKKMDKKIRTFGRSSVITICKEIALSVFLLMFNCVDYY